MSDPRRLLDDPQLAPHARALLDAGRTDAPSGERKAAIAATVLASAAASHGLAWATAAKVLAGVVLVGAMAGGGYWMLARRERLPAASHASPASPASLMPPGQAPPRPDQAPPPESPPVPSPPAAAPSPTASPAPADPTPPPAGSAPSPRPARPSVPSAPAPATFDPRALAEEVALVDRARAALRANDAAGALAAIGTHGRRFPDGELRAEATLLRAQALAARGDHRAAAAAARDLLARFPGSSLAARARALLEIDSAGGSATASPPAPEEEP